jgi:drug/metabolite transporter (DMT)-like permease
VRGSRGGSSRAGWWRSPECCSSAWPPPPAAPPAGTAWLACLIGTVCCLPFAADLVRALGSAATVGWIAYLGVMPTAVAFTTWAYALARTSAGRLGTMTYLVPPLAIAMGWAFLGETPALLAVVGGAVCLAGVYVSQKPTSSRTSTTTPRPRNASRSRMRIFPMNDSPPITSRTRRHSRGRL